MTNKTKKAMSLGEVLICLAVVGLIAGITMPVLMATVPNKNEATHKKASYVIEHTVSDLVNNDTYYPVRLNITVDEDSGDTHVASRDYGLRNTGAVTVDGVTYGSDSAAGIDTAAKEQKFCRLVASKFKLYPGSEVNCTEEGDGSDYHWNFTSFDGVKWKLPIYAFAEDDDAQQNLNSRIITFRTGDRRGGDCDENDANHCKNPNIFHYTVTSEGRLYKTTATSDSIKPVR